MSTHNITFQGEIRILIINTWITSLIRSCVTESVCTVDNIDK